MRGRVGETGRLAAPGAFTVTAFAMWQGRLGLAARAGRPCHIATLPLSGKTRFQRVYCYARVPGRSFKRANRRHPVDMASQPSENKSKVRFIFVQNNSKA